MTGSQEELTAKGHKGTLWDNWKVLDAAFGWQIQWIHKTVKTHPTEHLRSVRFIMCKVYVKKIKGRYIKRFRGYVRESECFGSH